MDHTLSDFLIAGFSCLIPIVIWGYLVSALEERATGFPTKLFWIGIASGSVSVLPILVFDMGRKYVYDGNALFLFFSGHGANLSGMGIEMLIPVAIVLLTSVVFAYVARGRMKRFVGTMTGISLPNFLAATLALGSIVGCLYLLGFG